MTAHYPFGDGDDTILLMVDNTKTVLETVLAIVKTYNADNDLRIGWRIKDYLHSGRIRDDFRSAGDMEQLIQVHRALLEVHVYYQEIGDSLPKHEGPKQNEYWAGVGKYYRQKQAEG